MREFIGYISSIALAVCTVPEVIKSIKNGHSNGLSWGFLLLWYLGAICGIIYILPLRLLPSMLNYVLSIFLLSIISWYKLFPRKKI